MLEPYSKISPSAAIFLRLKSEEKRRTRKTALLSQEGSGIAKRIPRGVVPTAITFRANTAELSDPQPQTKPRSRPAYYAHS